MADAIGKNDLVLINFDETETTDKNYLNITEHFPRKSFS